MITDFVRHVQSIYIKNIQTYIWPVCMVLLTVSAPGLLRGQQSNYINGRVTEEITGRAVSGCSVYFSNTSKGDITSATGEFVLKNLPSGKYELVISAIGYETEVVMVSSNNYPHKLQVQLRVHAAELSEVTIQPFLKDGWIKWGSVFLENFIGTTANAGYCRLLNVSAIKICTI